MKALPGAVFALLLGACAGPGVEQYRAEGPALDLRTYFDGPVSAWGIVQDRSGTVVKRFRVRIDAHWSGDTGVLDEHFEWSDGTRSRRVWTLQRQADGSYRGRADDVIGEARGEVAGNALRWRYTLALPYGGSTWRVDFDDWMYLIDDRVMINRAVMSKWGLRLADVTLGFSRP